ncbi:hypothetical protein FJ251_00565 [bacterium]|nr:hypothetical protein [bacterium]
MQASFSLGALLGILMRRRRLILLGTAVATAVAILLALFVLPRRYAATASLLPEAESSVSPLGALLGQAGLPFGLNLFGEGGSNEVQREILASYSVCQRVVDTLDLYTPYDLTALRGTNPEAAEQEAVARLQEALAVEIDDASRVLRVTATAPTAALAQGIVRQLIVELDRFNQEALREQGGRKERFLAERLGNAQTELARARRALADFSAQEGVVHLPAELEAELALVGELNRQLVFKELERAVLAADAAPDAPALRSLTAEISALRSQLATLEAEGRGLPQRIKPLRELPALALRYYELRRELAIQEEIANLLVQQLEQARLQAANTVSTLRVLDPPREPTLPVAPRKKLVVAGTAAIAFLVCCLWAFWLDFLERIRLNDEGRWEAWQWLPGALRSRRA